MAKEPQGKENTNLTGKPQGTSIIQKIKDSLQSMVKSNVFYYLIAICFLAFLLTKNPVFGILVAIFIFSLLLTEAFAGASSHGWKKEAKETGIALLAALIVWFGASFLLGTASPLNGIVTCSMLPNLERGDMVVLQGGIPKAQTIDVTPDDFISLTNPKATVYYSNSSLEVMGSIFAYCAQKKGSEALCNSFIESPESFRETRGNFQFNYRKCDVTSTNGAYIGYAPCLESISYKGQIYSFNKSNDIIVYTPGTQELYFPNDIIHRAFVQIKSGSKTYYITRGDNNVVADIQGYNYANGKFNLPPSQEQLKGHVLVRLPYIGYFKLFISFFQIGDLAFVEPQGCQTVLQS